MNDVFIFVGWGGLLELKFAELYLEIVNLFSVDTYDGVFYGWVFLLEIKINTPEGLLLIVTK
jgi:hypothetical protein